MIVNISSYLSRTECTPLRVYRLALVCIWETNDAIKWLTSDLGIVCEYYIALNGVLANQIYFVSNFKVITGSMSGRALYSRDQIDSYDMTMFRSYSTFNACVMTIYNNIFMLGIGD